ncbi:MAG: hypothetical protein KAT68_00655 [Bacteroidales bacterium]|nr:hypothetical protein [Bacteroidales bacterium]
MGFLSAILIGSGAIAAVSYVIKGLNTQATGDALTSKIKEVIFKGIKIRNFNAYVNFDISFEHTNPTNKNLTFNYMFLDMFIGDENIAEIRKSDMNKTVYANQVTKIKMPVSVSVKDLGVSVIKVFKSGNIPDKIKIKGNIKVNDFVSEYNEEYPLKKQ